MNISVNHTKKKKKHHTNRKKTKKKESLTSYHEYQCSVGKVEVHTKFSIYDHNSMETRTQWKWKKKKKNGISRRRCRTCSKTLDFLIPAKTNKKNSNYMRFTLQTCTNQTCLTLNATSRQTVDAIINVCLPHHFKIMTCYGNNNNNNKKYCDWTALTWSYVDFVVVFSSLDFGV